MEKIKFIEILNEKGILYKVNDEQIMITKDQGSVYLQSLTTLPDNMQFNNQGSVYLESLNNKSINYRGKKIDIKHIDGSTMIIKSSKKAGDFIIHTALYFKGGDFENMPKCVIAEKEGYFAHCDTVKSAISDCNFKFLQANFNINDLVKSIKEKQTITTNEYRLLTGACSFGVAQFMKEKNITAEELPLKEVIRITDGYYGNNKMKELFGEVR